MCADTKLMRDLICDHISPISAICYKQQFANRAVLSNAYWCVARVINLKARAWRHRHK